MKVASSQENVDAWWGGLTPAEQKNPVNIAKYNTANDALARAGEFLNAASTTVTNAGNSTVQYSLDKKQKNQWNFIIGSQFQLQQKLDEIHGPSTASLARRMQFIGGLQYRFGL